MCSTSWPPRRTPTKCRPSLFRQRPMQTLEHKPATAEEERTPAIPPRSIGRRAPRFRSDMALAVLVLSPSIIAVALFIYSFIGWTFYISTVNWNDILPEYTFVGLRNWLRMFGDERFQIDLRNLVLF